MTDYLKLFCLFSGPLKVLIETKTCSSLDELHEALQESEYGSRIIPYLQRWFLSWIEQGCLIKDNDLDETELHWAGWEWAHCRNSFQLFQVCMDGSHQQFLDWCVDSQPQLFSWYNRSTKQVTAQVYTACKNQAEYSFLDWCVKRQPSIFSWYGRLENARLAAQGDLKTLQWAHKHGFLTKGFPQIDSCFKKSCTNGHLELAQWLYSVGISQTYKEAAFFASCCHGHLHVAQWLYSLKDVNIHTHEDNAFRCSCENGHLPVAQWLYSLGDVNIHAKDEYAFRYSCENGHLPVAQWLYSLGDVNIHVLDDQAFRYSCRNGHLHVAQWLYSLGHIGVDDKLLMEVFVTCCWKGYLNILKWMVSTYSIGTFLTQTESLRDAICQARVHNQVDVVQWLKQLTTL